MGEGDVRQRDARLVATAVNVAHDSVAAGGGPFGALIVCDGQIVARGTNEVAQTNDPTAHAEVVAIRAACAAVGACRLTGFDLVCSCEPCPMCLGAALWARLDRVVYAADREDAATAGFDDRELHELFGRPVGKWPLLVRQHRTGFETGPFVAWRDDPHRQQY